MTVAKRRYMRRFKLHEISGVDRPAQEGAKVRIMKRMEPSIAELFAKYYVDPANGAVSFQGALESSMTSERYYDAMKIIGPEIEALSTSLRSILGDSSLDYPSKQTMTRNAVEDFMAVARNKWPDIESALHKILTPEAGDDNNQGVNSMTTKTVEQVQSDLDKMTRDIATSAAALTAATSKVTELTTSNTALTAKVDGQTADLAKATDQIKTLALKAAMTDEEKEHEARCADEDEKKKFREMSSEARKAEIKKRFDADEVIEVEGQKVRKSVVGETQFRIIKAQNERIVRSETMAGEERNRRLDSELTKRAETTLNHLPGALVAKVAALKIIDAIPDTSVVKVDDGKGGQVDASIRKTLTDMLEAGDKAISAAYSRVGVRGGNSVDLSKGDAGSFEKRVDEIAVRDKVDKMEANRRARKEFPQEFAAYQASGNQAGN